MHLLKVVGFPGFHLKKSKRSDNDVHESKDQRCQYARLKEECEEGWCVLCVREGHL